ncbi:hypothetical protein QC281_47725, partial [Streptomyces sp. DH17]|nr:hypothetical protein [Streptomyces sp. DH17]
MLLKQQDLEVGDIQQSLGEFDLIGKLLTLPPIVNSRLNGACMLDGKFKLTRQQAERITRAGAQRRRL